MDVTVVEKSKEQLILRIKGVNASYMNALRRTMMANVPVLAIEDVEIRKNSSALYDEIIAHRLGMLSITTEKGNYSLPSECMCKGAGCAQCQVKLTLKAQGPKTVYAGEMKSSDPKAKPFFEKTPIVSLIEGQEIELEATAVMGVGVEHAKWNAGLVYYKEYPHITIKKQPDNAKALANKYNEVLELKAGKLSIKEKAIPYFDVFDSLVAESDGALHLDYKDDYLLTIESWQQLTPHDIVLVALERFTQELDEVKTLVKAAA